jgi:hypothetical protein
MLDVLMLVVGGVVEKLWTTRRRIPGLKYPSLVALVAAGS